MAEYTPQEWEDGDPTKPPSGARFAYIEAGLVKASIPTKVTSLPVTPYDGQEVYFEADEAAGIYWHLRFRSASASDYKWEFLGGPSLHHEILTLETTASTVYADLATVGPTLTLPLEGDYKISFGAEMFNSASATVCAPKLGAAATSNDDSISAPANASSLSLSRGIVRPGLAASAVVKLQYRTGSGTLSALRRHLSVRPRRVI